MNGMSYWTADQKWYMYVYRSFIVGSDGCLVRMIILTAINAV